MGPPDEVIDFHHPYTPYDVQTQFMTEAYKVLQTGNGQIGILESPTGTVGVDLEDEPDWIIEQTLQRKRDDISKKWKQREQRLEQIRLKEKARAARSAKRRRIDDGNQKKVLKNPEDEEAEWLLDDADEPTSQSDALSGLGKETLEILSRYGLGGLKRDKEDEEILEDGVKIFYTSRTHSQLSQFVAELRRPSFPSSMPSSLVSGEHGAAVQAIQEPVKHLPLSSRQKLCINPAVSRLKTQSAINDRCAELQQPKSKNKCPYVPKEENLNKTHQFRDTAHATLPDIEDLFHLGKSLEVCPYYASRTAIAGTEIITLPYPLLLQKTAREALGIKLEGNIVIVDEAHNIMDAVANVYASEIRLGELKRARLMLGVYVKRFGKKLKGENRVMVGQPEQGIVDAKELLRSKGIDQINLFKLIQYIQTSKLAYKIESYVAYVEEDDSNKAAPRSSTPVLHTFVSFLVSLTNLSSEGRIFYQKLPGAAPDIQLSYLLLSPTHAFSSIATSARAVILAGGTMSPFDDYRAHLFPYLPEPKLTTLRCGHVIPPSNLCVRTLAASRAGDPNSTFEFSFQRRSDKAMVNQLGLAILNMCAVVPDGIVVFFPSYGYLDEVVAAWETTAAGESTPIWTRMQQRKAVFKESKGASSEEVLALYSEAILGDGTSDAPKPRGALLLSVVGGKMSEGINFSDRLGRAVMVVGLPYPNMHSPEWKAKTEYVEMTVLKRALEAEPGVDRAKAQAAAKQAARDFYENACMRAVNQSIGRAIRHRGDYAAIILCDRRYGTERIKGKLPGWIQGGIQGDGQESGLPQLMGALSGFFRGKRGT
ncbi:hypothetical protein VD0002_g65 [Verticillium dahliae]|uniref:ATP-dependent DNA helicase CHL1 n=1 Tax=Verticillium dahliae TaxID=27337 RepID=A0AA44WBC6_VERDA|nr:hypothetical protein BJF96_g8252 [Verticillium dahliae]PNH70743.1 hypothetical protein VD0002_g65 [Verticillium dahliae]